MGSDLEKRRAASGLSLIGFASLVALACGSSRDVSNGVDPRFDDAGASDGGACGYRCSPDLKKVLRDCAGTTEIVQECPSNEGCGVDRCVSACDAAALSKGSAGCAFWTLPPDDFPNGAGECFAAMVANTWDRPVGITAEWGADPLDISRSTFTASRTSGEPVYTRLDGPLPPGQVALVFLSQAKDLSGDNVTFCPPNVTPAVDVDPMKHGTARTKAFHIKTDAPVAAYSIFPYGGAESFYPSATLLLPESSWGTSYIGVTASVLGDPENAFGLERTMQIVAKEDGTEVSIRPAIDLARGDDVEPAAAGEVTTWTLQRGQVLQFTQDPLRSGSPIQSSKPVGLFGGGPCAFLPGEKGYCDLFQQQIAPFSQWGTEYALVPYRSRIEGPLETIPEKVAWSFVGAVDGTELAWSPSKPPGAPDVLAAGQVASFMTTSIVSVKSQDKKHPFHAAVYMTSAMFGGGTDTRTLGDPDFVNIVPSDQFLDRYVFFTDYTYPETSLTVVRRKTAGEFKPVSIECGGEIGGWKAIGENSDYEYAWVVLTTGFVPQKFPKGECGYGRQLAESDGPFAITVWGLGRDASYGYAGGMGSRPVNEAPPPVIR